MSIMWKTISQPIPTTRTSEIYICTQQETEETEEAEEESEESEEKELPKQDELATRHMPLRDKEADHDADTETSEAITTTGRNKKKKQERNNKQGKEPEKTEGGERN